MKSSILNMFPTEILLALQSEDEHNDLAFENNKNCKLKNIIPYQNKAFLDLVEYCSGILLNIKKEDYLIK